MQETRQPNLNPQHSKYFLQNTASLYGHAHCTCNFCTFFSRVQSQVHLITALFSANNCETQKTKSFSWLYRIQYFSGTGFRSKSQQHIVSAHSVRWQWQTS